MGSLPRTILIALATGVVIAGVVVPLTFLNIERAEYREAAAGWELERASLRETIDGRDLMLEVLRQMLEGSIATAGPAPSRITLEDFLLEGGTATITLHNVVITTTADSGSMLPWLAAGTTIVLERTNEVGVGDVAVYEKDGGQVIHRIVGEQDGRWVFKGDNNSAVEMVEKDRVIWRLIAVFY
jgi:hypothetical protein